MASIRSIRTVSSYSSARTRSDSVGSLTHPVPAHIAALDAIFPLASMHKPVWKSTRLDPDSLVGKTKWKDTPIGKKTMRWDRFGVMAPLLLGVVGAVLMNVFVWIQRPKERYCLVLDENFDTLDTSVWQQDVQIGDDYGYNTFQMFTDSTNNSFVEDGILYIVPTLTSDYLGEKAVSDGGNINMTFGSPWGTCTTKATGTAGGVTGRDPCYANANASLSYILPSVQSARLTTKLSHSIQYGRVEISARMPSGDWLWPTIKMLPRDDVYGAWPVSGQIDIVQSRGNEVTARKDRNVNAINGQVLWGIDDQHLAKKGLTSAVMRKYFDANFYSLGLDWTKRKIFTWKDKRSRQLLSFEWAKGLHKQDSGKFASNPWAANREGIVQPAAAPFDQEFYLDLSVQVGGQAKYFADGGKKPWSDIDPPESAQINFWGDRDNWYPTWPTDVKQRALAIDYIRLYRLLGDGETC